MQSYHLTQEQATELFEPIAKPIKTVVALRETIHFVTDEQLQAYANAVLDKVLGEQWQPIDTVPVNESVLMLRMGKHGRCGMADGYKQENGVLAWPYINKEPTHWMPLPSAPKEQS